MTEDIRRARREVKEALRDAEEKKAIGSRLAEEWRKSRKDNNFRAILRDLGGAA